ncbi:hypothetical protein PC123_g22380 [Phytophthora cactorum]|nr:hypothetical protein PC123_g22380 [Phytophthora cactorum]
MYLKCRFAQRKATQSPRKSNFECGYSFDAHCTSVTDTIFLESIVVTGLVFLAGSAYFFRVVLPKIENKTLGSPVTTKDMNENLLSSRSQVLLSTGA